MSPEIEPVAVTITPAQMEAGVHMGRRFVAISGGHNRYELDHGDGEEKRRVENARARLALARHFGGTMPLPVRLHYSPLAAGQLIVVEPDEHAHFLVTGRGPAFHLRGWVWGHELQERGVWRDDVPAPAWFVSDLRDVRTFPTTKAAS